MQDMQDRRDLHIFRRRCNAETYRDDRVILHMGANHCMQTLQYDNTRPHVARLHGFFETYIHTYLHKHACIHRLRTYIYKHACIHTYINTYTYIHTYVHKHACIHTLIHACMYAYIHTCIHVHAYIHAYIYTTYIHIYSMNNSLNKLIKYSFFRSVTDLECVFVLLCHLLDLKQVRLLF